MRISCKVFNAKNWVQNPARCAKSDSMRNVLIYFKFLRTKFHTIRLKPIKWYNDWRMGLPKKCLCQAKIFIIVRFQVVWIKLKVSIRWQSLNGTILWENETEDGQRSHVMNLVCSSFSCMALMMKLMMKKIKRRAFNHFLHPCDQFSFA